MGQKRRALLLVSLEVAVAVGQQHLLRRWSNCPKIDRRSQHGHLHWHSQVAASPKQDTIGTGGLGPPCLEPTRSLAPVPFRPLSVMIVAVTCWGACFIPGPITCLVQDWATSSE
ncbi:hypothetical protein FVEG_15162 [Fusarium verticillioides 7600]|uniref:Secreted protein n=1 Tax=Gibberella moniliformis (strain M3125 / FGSC 7600) TaxID=334819 RepID=W7LZ37_GIBM7|nr:hypothetical protein FVEG_15162 [Fusarium verticillioides 7600]EWG40694.1 hypothetical protein FVEG_15162 [Fusarium verticillioides 7600]